MGWLFLVGAIVFEVAGTIGLRAAADGARRWVALVVVGYLISFTMLSLALSHGIPLGVAYGVWSAAGIALTAVLGRVLFREPLTWVMGLGIVLIVGGVVMVEIGSS